MKRFFRVLGLMSGTSLDGLDIAQCTFELKDQKWLYVIEKAITFAYSKYWYTKLSEAENLSGKDLMLLHNEFGVQSGIFINDFLKSNPVDVDFVASHGHTIYHQPQKKLTLQIGNGACIAAITGITTICDFRSMDVALGGQGAPLVPIGDSLLFDQYTYCLNLGGFANISQNIAGRRIAFDICPVNVIINHLVKTLNIDYDKDGEIARKGKLNIDLLNDLNNLEFYSLPAPKSLGKEWVIEKFLPVLNNYSLTLEDKLRTIYQHIVLKINEGTQNRTEETILITGGGAYNIFLLELLRNCTKTKIIIPEKEIINYKEALIFAFLGVLRYTNQSNCLKSVTGAFKDNIGGAIYQV